MARQIGIRLMHEAREALPPTIFFFLGFNIIVQGGGPLSLRGAALISLRALALRPVPRAANDRALD
jgi:hypothetical protein